MSHSYNTPPPAPKKIGATKLTVNKSAEELEADMFWLFTHCVTLGLEPGCSDSKKFKDDIAQFVIQLSQQLADAKAQIPPAPAKPGLDFAPARAYRAYEPVIQRPPEFLILFQDQWHIAHVAMEMWAGDLAPNDDEYLQPVWVDRDCRILCAHTEIGAHVQRLPTLD